MSAKQYMLEINSYINRHYNIKRIVIFLDRYSPFPVTWGFYITIAYLVLNADIRVFYVAVLPWLNFFVVSAVRSKLNFKRPFEELGFQPLIPHSSGKSCPSRHATSSVIISFAIYYIFPPGGIFLGILSVVICATRVLTGVHYIRDVIWGAGIGAITGYIGFFVILS